jgi:DNA/RNA endonuclease G (NUC1)
VYGGGGNSGATYKNDFIELFNRGTNPAPINGWSLQYASATGTGNFGSANNLITPLPNVSIPAGGYLLIYGVGGTNGVNIPVANDVTDLTPIDLAAGSGKVALVNTITPLGCNGGSNTCSPASLATIVDLVGYGSANFFEAASAPVISATLAIFRDNAGCTDTDNNGADFSNTTSPISPSSPNPRNSQSSVNICQIVTNTPPSINSQNPGNPAAVVNQDSAPFTITLSGSDDNSVYSWTATSGSGVASVNVTTGQGTSSVTYTVALQSGFTGTATFTASLSDTVNSSVSRSVNIQVNPNVANFAPSIIAPANPIITVAQDALPFTVSLNGSDDNNIYNWSGTVGAGVSSISVTSGQGTFNPTYTVTLQPGFSGTANFTASLSDNFNAPVTQTVNIAVTPAPPPPLDHIVISQVYGGGGNSGATYQNDFVELFNPDTASHDLSGWTIQYASDTGTSWQVQPLGGTMAPGEYYLIKLATNGAIGAVVPEANINGNLNLSGTNGKVALVRNGDALNGCVVGDPVVDLVGYGSSANCREGASNAPAPSATNSIFRKNGGFTDTNVNGADFATGAPNPNRRTTPIVELPPTTLSSDPRKNSNNAPRDASITVTFTEPVDVADGWFSISCATTGSHNSATVAPGGSNGWIIIPNVNFQPGEQCSITVNKEFVHDSDLDDSLPNTDQLTSSYSATFTVAIGAAPAYPADVHLTFGNPSGAATDLSTPNNYLMIKPEYSLSYNKDRGTANWVSWHLADEWIGSLDRVDTFRADPAVPADWYRVTHLDYTGSGFDRGHMVPNADRDPETSTPINQATFLMSNMIPQAPDNNQGPWANLENYLRTLLPANEIYIVAGGAGTGGTGSNGSKTTIANGKVTVPARTWKVALVIPKQNGDDVSRVNASARTIAVNMPNIQGIRTTNPNDWQNYLVSIDQVEALTGYDFFSNLPDAVENSIEAGVNGVNPPGTESFSVSTVEDTSKSITLNAVNANNNPLVFTIVNAAAHGTLTGTGTDRVYTPATDFVGTDSFTFRASDGSNNSNISTVTITVTEYNENPIANNDAKSTQEDTQLTFGAFDLLLNDIAGDSNEIGQTLNVTNVAVTANTHGTVTFSAGQITYIPDANYNGSAGFNYQVCDNGTTNGAADAKCATGVVNVTIAPVNDNPVANTDSAITDEDTAITIDVLGNDTDIDADNISIESVGNAAKGILVVTGGKVLYTPNQNANGADSFSYTINDGHGGISTGTVNVVINSINDAPTAITDSAATDEDTSVTIDAAANDTDVDEDSLSLVSATNGAHGTVAIVGGKAVYTPQENYFGSDSFTYTVSDGAKTAEGTVSVAINSVNDNPVAASDSAATNEDVPVTIDVVLNDTDVDGDALTLTGVGTPINGTVSVVGGKAVFSPAANYHGIGTFSYMVSDNHGGTSSAVVTVTINSVNDNPVAGNDSAATNEDTPVTIDVRGNDSDVDGDQLSITNVIAPAKGTAVITADGKILYTPNPNQNGADSFVYAISDGQGGTATAAVNVSINPVNDAPTLAPISNKTVVLGNTLSFTAVASDIDLPAQSLTFGFVGEVPAGAAINSATGAFSWTPTQAQVGKIYNFTIRVTDSGNLSSEQNFTVAIAYEWSNFLQPINSTGENSFNAGSTIPVKFKLTGASEGIANATATLWLAKVVNNVPGAEFPAESSGNSNTGNLFRHDGNGQYSFNLSTKNLSTGDYRLRVDLGDGVLRTVLITLR